MPLPSDAVLFRGFAILGFAYIAMALPLHTLLYRCYSTRTIAIPLRCNALRSRCKAVLCHAIAIPRHTVAERRNSEPYIAAAMLGFAYIALALLSSTQRCLCFAAFSAAELGYTMLYHCLVMLVYTLPLPNYSLSRSTLP